MRIAFLLAPALALLALSGCPGTRAQGVVEPSPSFPLVRVVDGDTVVLRMNGREESVRLIGVDTPEKHPSRKLDADARRSGRPAEAIQALGREASRVTAGILGEGPVQVEFDVQERDRYGRLLAYLYVRQENGRVMVNREILRRGWADVLTIPPNVRYAEEFRAIAREAKEAGRGLWGEPSLLTGETGSGRADPEWTGAAEGCEPAGGACPEGCPVKGNVNRAGERIYHVPGGSYYGVTVPEACFPVGAAAEAAGFRASLH